ncbi:MAG TPA: hypothetical protein VMD07_08565, partial [Candidatus Acidoferrales bacterium]|nr:hypothetical protein [Candidatus Acidoferrales bacterium]
LVTRGEFMGGVAAVAAAPAAAGLQLRFELYARYYSRQLQIVPAIDPQVFVSDPSVLVGGIGLQNIEHIAGLRALTLDGPDLPLFTADGVHMGFTSKRWIGASGTGTVADLGNGAQRITLSFENLVVFGTYSLFKHFVGASGVTLVPLDGTGRTSAFTADALGSARLAVQTPQALDPNGAITLVYNSDGKPHRETPGPIGLTAHDHLIATLNDQPA